jgi:hypothetical protein
LRLAEEKESDVDPYADDEDEFARRGYEREPRAGRLVADDEGFGEDEQPDEVAHDAGSRPPRNWYVQPPQHDGVEVEEVGRCSPDA